MLLATATIGMLLATFSLASPSQAVTIYAKSYKYGSHARQAVDAYWTKPKSGYQPAIVLVHGGFWNGGSRKDWAKTAKWYAARGFAVFSIDHRFDTDAPWPAPRDDMFAALNWVKKHYKTFRVHKDRIAVLGSQAGGHLAAHAGTVGTGGNRVRAVVGLSPVLSPHRAYNEAQLSTAPLNRRKLRDQTVILANCTPAAGEATCLDIYQDMTPAKRAGAGDAPMLSVHSKGDTVPNSHGDDLKKALAAKGVTDVMVKTVSGSKSGGSLLDTTLRSQVLTWIRNRTKPRASSAAIQSQAVPSDAAPPIPVRKPSLRSDDHGTVSITAGSGTAADPTAGERIEQSFTYGTHERHRIDTYHYSRKEPQPAILLIHGGYWYEGDKGSWRSIARRLADDGFAVFAMNYRLNTQSRWTAQRTDVVNSLAWIRAQAGAFNVDPSRIGLLGSSAGGHLAVNTGTYGTGTARVKAVAALSPVASPYQAYATGQLGGATAKYRKLRDTAVLLGRCTPVTSDKTCWSRWTDMVAFNQASTGDAPMFLMHSENEFVPPSHSIKLCTKLTAVAVPCTTRVAAGDAHATSLLNDAENTDVLFTWLKDNI